MWTPVGLTLRRISPYWKSAGYEVKAMDETLNKPQIFTGIKMVLGAPRLIRVCVMREVTRTHSLVNLHTHREGEKKVMC